MPWNMQMTNTRRKSCVTMPQTEATKRASADKTRTGRLPKTLARGTQKMLPSPSQRMLNWACQLGTRIRVGGAGSTETNWTKS